VSGPARRSSDWDPRVIVVLLVAAGIAFGTIAAFATMNADVAAPASSEVPTPAASAAAPASASAGPVPSASASAPRGSGPVAVIDHTLLALLPATVAGLPVRAFPEAETQAAGDPDLGRNVARLATAFVGDANGANWAYTAIVDVRPESRSDAFYRDWQESFDASACEPAGGVGGHTKVVIAGHDVERTACGAGVVTYHVRLTGGLLLSISDLGDARLGEQEIKGLP
jgi:hypothetical protein